MLFPGFPNRQTDNFKLLYDSKGVLLSYIEKTNHESRPNSQSIFAKLLQKITNSQISTESLQIAEHT